MLQPDPDHERLSDIIESAARIARFIEGMDYASFLSSEAIQSAVAYQLVIIGEASGNLSAALKESYPKIPWRAIKGLRNVAAHEYKRLDQETVWVAAVDEVPLLVERVAGILQDVFP